MSKGNLLKGTTSKEIKKGRKSRGLILSNVDNKELLCEKYLKEPAVSSPLEMNVDAEVVMVEPVDNVVWKVDKQPTTSFDPGEDVALFGPIGRFWVGLDQSDLECEMVPKTPRGQLEASNGPLAQIQ